MQLLETDVDVELALKSLPMFETRGYARRMEDLDNLTRDQLLERVAGELEQAKPGGMNPAGANVHAGRAQVYASLLVERALRARD